MTFFGMNVRVDSSMLDDAFLLVAVQIVELESLREHEATDPKRLWRLMRQIKADGMLKFAIAIDQKTKIILDGEHRFTALKKLGCHRIPVVAVDYDSPLIIVKPWRKGEHWTKQDVKDISEKGEVFPPTTTKHMIQLRGKLTHISIIEQQVNTSLEELM